MAKTILVVEDDQNISELLRLYLEKEGYTVNRVRRSTRSRASSRARTTISRSPLK